MIASTSLIVITLSGAVLHDFTIGLFDMRRLITCIFDEKYIPEFTVYLYFVMSKANN